MYDIHCHILPGCDDGPEDWNAALELAQALVDNGVTTVAATPHGPGSNQSFAYDPQKLRSQVMRLREYIQRKRLSLQVVLGTELVLSPTMLDELKHGTLLPYSDTQTILLEAPTDFLSDALDYAIYSLQLARYRVILAHPERTNSVQENPNSLLPLIERGVYIQMTASSLTGYHGAQLQQVATTLLTHDMVHILASDAHSAQGKRCPQLREAVEIATYLIGETKAQALVQSTPEQLLNDQSVVVPEPRRIGRNPVAASSSKPSHRRKLWFLGKA